MKKTSLEAKKARRIARAAKKSGPSQTKVTARETWRLVPRESATGEKSYVVRRFLEPAVGLIQGDRDE